MAEESGSWKVPVLTRVNHEKWFRLMEAKLEGKGIVYIVQQTLEQYAKVATPDFNATMDKDLEELFDTPSLHSATDSRIFLNIRKRRNTGRILEWRNYTCFKALMMMTRRF